MESGAEVFTAATEQDMERMADGIGLDLVLVALPRRALNSAS